MGDATELTMNIEFAFDIEIPEREAEQMQTPGQLADWLFPLLCGRSVPKADAPDIFAVAQQRVVAVLRQASPGCGRITRATKLEKALPQQTWLRNKTWGNLNEYPHYLPPLERRDFSGTATGILLYSLPFGIAIGLIKTVGRESALFFWLSVGLFAMLLAIMPPLIRRVKLSARHPSLRTVGELVDFIVLQNYWHLAQRRGSWNEPEAWRVLQKLIAREGGIEAEQVQRDTPFSEILLWD